MNARVLGLAIAATLALPAVVAAQAQWLPPTEGDSWSVEYVHPHIVGDPAGTKLALDEPWVEGGIFLSAEHPLVRRVRLRVELPLASMVGRDSDCLDGYCLHFQHTLVLGNPYVGLDLQLAGPALRWQVGLRPPVQDQGTSEIDYADYYHVQAVRLGLLAGRGDRDEAFRHQMTSGITSLEFRPRLGGRNQLRIYGGALLGYDGDAFEPFEEKRTIQWRAGAQLWHRHGPAQFSAGVSRVSRRYVWSLAPAEYQWTGSAGLRLGDWLPLVQASLPSQPGLPWGPPRRWWTLGLALQHVSR